MNLGINQVGLQKINTTIFNRNQFSTPAFRGDVNNSTSQPKEVQEKKKAGSVQKFKNFIAGLKKFGINVAEYTKGTAKGLFKGTIAFFAAYGGLSAITALSKTKMLPKPLKITLSSIVGVIPLVTSLFDSSLNVSEKTAKVDHRYNTGHRSE